MSSCGVNIGGAEGFPLEEMEPEAPSGWAITGLIGGDDWAAYNYLVGEDKLTVVVCAAGGADGVGHCRSFDGPAETILDLSRFPDSEWDLDEVTIVCDGTNPCDKDSIQGLVAAWNAPG